MQIDCNKVLPRESNSKINVRFIAIIKELFQVFLDLKSTSTVYELNRQERGKSKCRAERIEKSASYTGGSKKSFHLLLSTDQGKGILKKEKALAKRAELLVLLIK